jgi:bifunctional enzyme CysN/CysC
MDAVKPSWGKLIEKDLLHLITCGSVDDGKSTLIGRLLYDSNLIPDDQRAALERDSRRYGTRGNDLDFALLVDGLQAEREQGITIDVAYRYFATARRAFIVADTPGHEQFTRNMATGASGVDLAIILIDARRGVLVQTRRHSLICSLLGIRNVLVAVNKMDLVDYDEKIFDRLVGDYTTFASDLGFASIVPIPISACFGDNVTTESGNTPWYRGPTLLQHLETVDIETERLAKPVRFPVQWVNRPNLDFRGYAGTVASGQIKVGQVVIEAISGRESTVKEIHTYDGSLCGAEAGDAITITLSDELDIGRGSILVSAEERPEVSDQFAANIIWMSDESLFPGRSYVARIGTKTTPITITEIKHKVDVNTRKHLAARTLEMNDIGVCNLSTLVPVAFDPYDQNKSTGAFIIIDRYTNHTVGAGMIAFGLRRGHNIPWQQLLIGKADRAAIKAQRPGVIWFTGLSGAGKSTIANMVERKLHAASRHTMLLDGDNLRHGLNRDLGFTEADRVENIRRVGEVAKLMLESGLIVLCSFISPYRAERDGVRNLVESGEFMEVFVDTPIDECIRRDSKGLYAKAKSGELRNFTGVDAPYESPENPELHLCTLDRSPEELAQQVIHKMVERGMLGIEV